MVPYGCTILLTAAGGLRDDPRSTRLASSVRLPLLDAPVYPKRASSQPVPCTCHSQIERLGMPLSGDRIGPASPYLLHITAHSLPAWRCSAISFSHRPASISILTGLALCIMATPGSSQQPALLLDDRSDALKIPIIVLIVFSSIFVILRLGVSIKNRNFFLLTDHLLWIGHVRAEIP